MAQFIKIENKYFSLASIVCVTVLDKATTSVEVRFATSEVIRIEGEEGHKLLSFVEGRSL